jgi:hypothetical protein
MLKTAIKVLGRRHAVNVKYLLNDSVEDEFRRCLVIASNAFLDRIKKYKNYKEEDEIFFVEYMKNKQVVGEISNLLDPGFEIFDVDLLVSYFEELASKKGFTNYSEKNVKKAWDEFLRAFSFSSRSAPALREFLRASYEAGSFHNLANVSDVIERLGNTIDAVDAEEKKLKQLIQVHSNDLQDYRIWADHFSVKE